MGAFKAYDIRGIYPQDFNKETVYKIGAFLPGLLGADFVVVGRDVRVSSPEIFQALSEGITDVGCDVWDIGLATTPMVYFSTVHFKAEASVQITASHNPPQYNGLKISRKGAIPVGYDTGLKDLEQLVLTKEVKKASKKGKILRKDAKTPYIQFQKQFVPDVSNLDISIDCSNGMLLTYAVTAGSSGMEVIPYFFARSLFAGSSTSLAGISMEQRSIKGVGMVKVERCDVVIVEIGCRTVIIILGDEHKISAYIPYLPDDCGFSRTRTSGDADDFHILHHITSRRMNTPSHSETVPPL